MSGAPTNLPPEDQDDRPRSRSGRILGLATALGFSLAMWVFIAMAVLGLVLKFIG